MRSKIILLLLACALATRLYAQRGGRPNILWLTFEDASAYNLGCYGNRMVHTPNMDSLAANGIIFMNASSVAPQCSPSRSTIISGSMATSYGMDFHPRRINTPDNILFPKWLGNAGYFCTNNSKTDYNTTSSHAAAWSENGKEASYNSVARKPGQPFFSVFNSVASHMGVARTFHTDGRRNYAAEGLDVSKAVLPPYLPDLPEIRSDYGAHLEGIQGVDQWIGGILSDLQAKGLADSTIIFVFSDHGGIYPRSKGYIYETGLRPALIMYIPPALRAKGLGKLPRKESRMVDFTDLAPTVLALAGVKAERKLSGVSLLDGKSLAARKYRYAFATNQLHHFNPLRSVSDGRYKLIRSYIPYKQFALRNYYQWGMPSNTAWDKLILSGKVTNPVFSQPYDRRPAEMLFDLQADPYETNNLSADPWYAQVLAELRNALAANIRSTKDVGFFDLADRKDKVLYDEIRKPGFPVADYFNIVEKAGTGTEKDIDLFKKYIGSDRAVLRYWAAVGLANLAVQGRLVYIPELGQAMKDKDPYVAAEAAFAAVYAGHETEGLKRLLLPMPGDGVKAGLSLLECISLDNNKKGLLMGAAGELKTLAKISTAENEDPAYMARGILVNIGLMDIADMYGEKAREEGLQLNRSRRHPGPSPVAGQYRDKGNERE